MTMQGDRVVPQGDPNRVPVETRWKQFFVTPEFLAAILTEGWRGDGWHTVSGIPKGSEVVAAHIDKETGAIVLVVAHGSFPVLPPGAVIPMVATLRIDNEATP